MPSAAGAAGRRRVLGLARLGTEATSEAITHYKAGLGGEDDGHAATGSRNSKISCSH